MLYISSTIAMIVIVVALMARRRRKYLRGAVDLGLALGTLAGNTVVALDVSDAVEDTTWLSSVKLWWSLKDYTNTNLAGPIICGVAHSDYTAAEIEEWIENLQSWSVGDLRSQEKARRKIRMVGSFNTESTGGTGPNTVYTLNDGKAIRTKCGWMLTEGQTLKVWWYNAGAVALASTSPSAGVIGHANLWPKD